MLRWSQWTPTSPSPVSPPPSTAWPPAGNCSPPACRDAIPRTRPPATLLALAGVVPAAALEGALDDALLRGLVSCAQLERRLSAAGRQGRRGAATLGELLAQRSGAHRWTQSEFERRLRRLVCGAGLPPPVPQFEVILPDGRTAFLDFAWPEVLLGIEADSYRHHARRRDWARDHVRNNLLMSLGWRILPVTWDDMVQRPREVVALLARARAAGSGQAFPALVGKTLPTSGPATRATMAPG